MPRKSQPKRVSSRNVPSSNATTTASLRLDPNDALLLRLFPTAAAALCTLPESARGRALAALREAIAARPKAPRGTASTDVDHTSDLAEAAIGAGKVPRDREEGPQLPTLTAASAADVCEFIKQWGRTDAATAPPPSSPDQRGWPSAQSKDGVLRLPPKPRRPQPLDVMPDAQPGVETIADYRADASNPVVSPWSLPLFEWSPRRRCCFTVVSFGVVDGTLRLVCSPLRVGPDSAAVCGPPIAVRCLFDATLHRGRCGAVPEALVGRHATVWDPFVWIAADGLHEVQVDSAKDVAFHLTEAEVAHYSAMDEQDGGYALRWLRKGKADGDALMKQKDYAAALRAYVHGLCKCYTRGPLDQPSSCIDELFSVSSRLTEAVKASTAILDLDFADAAVFCFAAGIQLFFSPDIGLSVLAAFDRVWSGSDLLDPMCLEPVIVSVFFNPHIPSFFRGFLSGIPLAAKYVGNMALACRKLQLWSPCVTAGLIAACMSSESDYVNKYRGYAAIAAANMGYNVSGSVTGEYAERSRRVCSLFTDATLFPEPDEYTDAPARHVSGAHVKVANPTKGRGVFTDCVMDDSNFLICLSLPFASSSGADLASIHYRDWTVPRDFAGLFRVLQQQCAAPCADLFMQQLHFLDGRNDGEFRQTLPWCHVPVSTIKRTPFLFHDMSLPLRQHVPESAVALESAHYGQRVFFDASRAIEVIGINASHVPARSPGSKYGPAVLHIGISMCNHSSVPNTRVNLTISDRSPMLMLQPLRPLLKGEEVTILYSPHTSGADVFSNRWKSAFVAPAELTELWPILDDVMDRQDVDSEMVKAAIVRYARTKLSWSEANLRQAERTPFVDFMLDFFKDFDIPLGGILHDLTMKGDPVVMQALPKDPRLVMMALEAGFNVSHFQKGLTPAETSYRRVRSSVTDLCPHLYDVSAFVSPVIKREEK